MTLGDEVAIFLPVYSKKKKKGWALNSCDGLGWHSFLQLFIFSLFIQSIIFFLGPGGYKNKLLKVNEKKNTIKHIQIATENEIIDWMKRVKMNNCNKVDINNNTPVILSATDDKTTIIELENDEM